MMHDPNKPIPNSEYPFDWLIKPIIEFFRYPKIWIEEYKASTGVHTFYVVIKKGLLCFTEYVEHSVIAGDAGYPDFHLYSTYSTRDNSTLFTNFEAAKKMGEDYVLWLEEVKRINKEYKERKIREELKQLEPRTIKRTQIK